MRNNTSLSLEARKFDVQFISRSDKYKEICLVVVTQNRLNQETFSDRKYFLSRHQQVLGSNEPLFRCSNLVNSAKSLLDGNRDHMLAEARSELMKQECKSGFSHMRTSPPDAEMRLSASTSKMWLLSSEYQSTLVREDHLKKYETFRTSMSHCASRVTHPPKQQTHLSGSPWNRQRARRPRSCVISTL